MNDTLIRKIRYAYNQRGYINLEAVFSDESENFVSPSEPESGETVTIRLRTEHGNVDGAFLYICRQNAEPAPITMRKMHSEGFFDWYVAEVLAERLSYYFTVIKQERVYYFNKLGLYPELDDTYNFMLIPDFITPDWAKGAVMYQIYIDRFKNGCRVNDVVNNEYAYLGKAARHPSVWNQPVPMEDFCNFYGGDLQGIIEKLGYLRDLGVEALYLNPIFVSPSNHKYDAQDYEYVDPHIAVIVKDGGEPLRYEKFHNRYATMYIARTTDPVNLIASNRLFARLVELAHQQGIKVIIDGVFNHCGAFNKWLDKENFYSGKGYPPGAYREENSPYHNYFKWYDSNWPNNDCYDSWWGFDNHPKLNYEASPELYNYIMNIAKKWVSPPYNADGWRLDVAADLGSSEAYNHKFWRDFRKAVKEANPNAIILAEHYGDPKNWLQGDEWDTVMNYDAFMEPITWFLTGMEKHSEAFEHSKLCNAMAFEGSMRYYMARMNVHALQMAMNELSNHDHSRFLTRTNMTVGRLHTMGPDAAEKNVNIGIMLEAVAFQMSWPGNPTIYYGDEAGLSGWTDPDNRRPYPWGRENKTIQDFHRACIKVRKTHPMLRTGSVMFLYNDQGIISYGRWNDEDHMAVILNNNSIEKTMSIPVWKMECALDSKMEALISSSEGKWMLDGGVYDVVDGMMAVTVGAYGSLILVEKSQKIKVSKNG
ncbi:MAG: glycoside hydrolase family 13 protein [Clostridiales bacterium]|jgi:alpha-glucosidase|nr:glycoside hydrolase family 13 protein [Clostridiales bacterium]